ncbi:MULTISPECIES: hypothetical protein [unclassified Leptospira]|uniref:hypothetical protein n=1 Tax=unclassified Leptospira TaxID=2633828 RepID=UPI000292767A|nr:MULTISPECIES: hypothetical protein [unclassified Leptospira]EKO77245.1 hypothetical protein LEP1GSC068_0489 [Leptospira sp. Fiocruz LV3954]EMI68021.1 hypothetical protein LEP1GSC076_0180 [Leptospira sp. Fiocruz LV4135]
MNLNSRIGRIVTEVKIAFRAFRLTNGYEPNEREKVGILNERGFINPIRIVQNWERLDQKLKQLANEIRKEEGV